jgi:hypothetical protein
MDIFIKTKKVKQLTALSSICLLLISCGSNNKVSDSSNNQLMGTWKLLTGTLIEKKDTTVTDYTKNTSFIKIINDSHFAFLQHDLKKGKDTAAVFVAGGGAYTLKGNQYTEHLQYCSAREWEGNDFTFTISINNDTLTSKGVEKVKGTGIDRINIERYVKMK